VKEGNYRITFLILLLIWFIINLVQAIFTDVTSDEAYYALFGMHLDWGFFDHPPAIALMTKLSSVFFTGNLGIRFMSGLLQLATICLIWKTAGLREPDSRRVILFFIIAFSISLFSAYGFIATPDAPLLFFAALFFLAYKKFLEEFSWTSVLLLSVSMAGMVYSKYQAVLVIGFIILSNLKLLKMYRFWCAGIFALVLLSPHIYWQFSHGFPSFRYHLIDRSEGFRWLFLLEYLPNQMAVFNPFTLGAVVYVMLKNKPTGDFVRGLYFVITGFILFFWVTASTGHVEPQWTIASSIPMILLLSDKIPETRSLLKYTVRFILPSILILIIIRSIIMTDLSIIQNMGFAGKDKKYKAIAEEAKELPVVFAGSFQDPSLYTFFTGKEAMVISSIYDRLTQFDIWEFERKLHNKPAFICVNADSRSKVYGTGSNQFSGFRTDSLQTVNRMKITFSLDKIRLNPGDTVSIPFSIRNQYDYDIDFAHRQFPVEVCMSFLKDEDEYIQQASLSNPVGVINPGVTVNRTLSGIIPDLPEGKFQFGISLQNVFGPAFNSNFVKITIGKDD
jgi:hypothetical protein